MPFAYFTTEEIEDYLLTDVREIHPLGVAPDIGPPPPPSLTPRFQATQVTVDFIRNRIAEQHLDVGRALGIKRVRLRYATRRRYGSRFEILKNGFSNYFYFVKNPTWENGYNHWRFESGDTGYPGFYIRSGVQDQPGPWQINANDPNNDFGRPFVLGGAVRTLSGSLWSATPPAQSFPGDPQGGPDHEPQAPIDALIAANLTAYNAALANFTAGPLLGIPPVTDKVESTVPTGMFLLVNLGFKSVLGTDRMVGAPDGETPETAQAKRGQLSSGLVTDRLVLLFKDSIAGRLLGGAILRPIYFKNYIPPPPVPPPNDAGYDATSRLRRAELDERWQDGAALPPFDDARAVMKTPPPDNTFWLASESAFVQRWAIEAKLNNASAAWPWKLYVAAMFFNRFGKGQGLQLDIRNQNDTTWNITDDEWFDATPAGMQRLVYGSTNSRPITGLTDIEYLAIFPGQPPNDVEPLAQEPPGGFTWKHYYIIGGGAERDGDPIPSGPLIEPWNTSISNAWRSWAVQEIPLTFLKIGPQIVDTAVVGLRFETDLFT